MGVITQKGNLMPSPIVTYSHTKKNEKHYTVANFHDVVSASIGLHINNNDLFTVTLDDGAFFAATWIKTIDDETTISNGIKIAYNLIFELDD